MRNIFGYIISVSVLMLASLSAGAQADRRDVRAGNRHFRKDDFMKAEIDYRKAFVKDTTSFAASYNLANALYRQDNFEEAETTLKKVENAAPVSAAASDYYYNLGNVACQKKDWKAAVDAYKQALLRNPGDLDAKENYIYAKLMMDDQEGGDGGDNQKDDNKDQQQQQQNQDQNQNPQQNGDQNDKNDQNQDQNNDQNNNQDRNNGQGQGNISPQQAQQMLNAIQAKEKETQDKVNKEKAALLKSKQKEKNW